MDSTFEYLVSPWSKHKAIHKSMSEYILKKATGPPQRPVGTGSQRAVPAGTYEKTAIENLIAEKEIRSCLEPPAAGPSSPCTLTPTE